MKNTASSALLFLWILCLNLPMVWSQGEEELKCDDWAVEGECVNNPNFMWSTCLSSCMALARDVRQECPDWGGQGECSKNPGFIQIHCPETCGYAIGWSVWARRASNVNSALPYDDVSMSVINNCMTTEDIINAAGIIYRQITTYLRGGAGMTTLLSSEAPSEYLGMYGLSEAVVYTMTLLKYNAKLLDEYIPPKNKAVDPILAGNITHRVKLLRGIIDVRLQEVHEVIGSGYESDTLMRHLPHWRFILDGLYGDSMTMVKEFVKMYPTAFSPTAVSSVTVEEECPQFNGPKIPSIAHFASDKIKESKTKVTTLIPLNDKVGGIPAIGLGTWQLQNAECEESVYEAIKLGYRHIDTAEAYGNEAWVGWAVHRAINESVVKREDLFIATKISREESGGYSEVKRLVSRQLELLQVKYIDLYMLHSPFRDTKKQHETWKALEELVALGTIKHLGVSNFDEGSLKKLLLYAVIKPSVVQNKVDLYHVGKQLDNRGEQVIALMREHGIIPVAYSAFSSYPFSLIPMRDPIVRFITARRVKNGEKVTEAQVILRWQLQHGMAVIPRSSNKGRLAENMGAMKMNPLTSDEMKLLDTLQFLTETVVSKAVAI